jgi:ABC-type nitrate/sulfonate/bicarbonate transport system permease component
MIRSLGNSRLALSVASLCFVLALWEALGRIKPLYTSYPSEIATAAWHTLPTEVLPAFGSTLVGFSVGLAIAAVIGVAVGFAMARVPVIEIALSPYVNALYATPRIALIPLLVIWLGIDFEMRVAIVVLSAVFPIIITVWVGGKETDGQLMHVGRAFLAGPWQRWRTIILPASLPYVFTGLRLGLARALTGIVVAEMTAAISGIGRLILDDARYFQTADLFVPLLLLGLLSIALTALLDGLQRRLTPWRQPTDLA